MKFELKPGLTLRAPDEMISYWWISEDFAGLYGVEYSSEAAKRLKKVLAETPAKIDYEADAVSLRVTKAKDVIPVLEKVYADANWDAAELIALQPQVLSHKRPKPKKLELGDVFLIPIQEDKWGVGQVIDIHFKHPTVVAFKFCDSRATAEAAQPTQLPVLTILHTHGESLIKGLWPIIGRQPVTHDPASGPGKKIFEVGSTSYGGDGPIVHLLEAQFGMRPWEGYYKDPNYLRKLVM